MTRPLLRFHPLAVVLEDIRGRDDHPEGGAKLVGNKADEVALDLDHFLFALEHRAKCLLRFLAFIRLDRERDDVGETGGGSNFRISPGSLRAGMFVANYTIQ